MPMPCRTHQTRYMGETRLLTVCGGGTLECPPGVETFTIVSTYPFSAMPGMAIVEPSMSPYEPAKVILVRQ
jgi:hypothetical protein